MEATDSDKHYSLPFNGIYYTDKIINMKYHSILRASLYG